MKTTFALAAAAWVMCVLCGIPARGQATQIDTFTYTGNSFTSFSDIGPGNPALPHSVTLSVTLEADVTGDQITTGGLVFSSSPLNPNSPILTWSVSDGLSTFNNNTANGYFDIYAQGTFSGGLSSWYVNSGITTGVFFPINELGVGTTNNYQGGQPSDTSSYNNYNGSFVTASNKSQPGTWTITPVTAVSWAQATSGSWSTASNWTPNYAPIASIDANFATGSASPYTVTLTSASMANNLNVQGNNVTLNCGLASPLTIGGTLKVLGTSSKPGSLTVTGSDGLSAAGGISIGTSSGAPNSAALTVNNSSVTGNVANYGQLNLLHSPTISGSVNNYGGINTWSPATAGAKTQNLVTINGNYVQASTGKLSMQISGLYTSDQLNITGVATLAGTLDVSVAGIYVPTVGDTIPIMNYGSVSGRFSTFNGAVIHDTNGNPIAADSNKFFGLLYGSNTLNLITLQVPQRVSANGTLTNLSNETAPGLILVTHGYQSSASAWANSMAQHIQNSKLIGDWDVVTMDWSQFSNGAILAPTAAENANDIGESLANWMREEGFNYQQMHLIGHSAGSWLINGLTDGLRNQASSAAIQETFLDAYNPSSIVLQGYANMPVLGKTATYAEQYYDDANAFLNGYGLATTLPYAVNYDVRPLAPLFFYGVPDIIHPHEWPHVWYDETVQKPSGPVSANGYGFAQSIEQTRTMPAYNGLQGKNITLPTGYAFNTPQYQLPLNLLALNHVTTGIVVSDGQGGVDLTANSATPPMSLATSEVPDSSDANESSLPSGNPSILTEELDFVAPMNMLALSAQFLSSGHGLLTAYLDGNEIFQIDELHAGSDQFAATNIYLGSDYQPGVNTLMLRLDPYDGLDSTVDIINIQFGFASTSIPEPATCGMALFTMVTGLVFWRRQRSHMG